VLREAKLVCVWCVLMEGRRPEESSTVLSDTTHHSLGQMSYTEGICGTHSYGVHIYDLWSPQL
jgi:hypothetical protein